MEKTKDEILRDSEKAFQRLIEVCKQIPDERFFFQPEDKWSIAQNIQHLITSTKVTIAAYSLPKFLIRLLAGKPNRPSRSFEGLVEKIQLKLANGGKATGRYIPKPIKPSIGKEQLLENWRKATAAYLKAVKTNWENPQLDQYIAPHPLLGKITLRELCYFTIYHTEHHLNIINRRA